ncbi:MAG: nucleotidyltransferase domain-containing protein, partial [Bacteriovoracaceae bacterium]|nr:nucleotidyltransferase domain-containing protein [Bacteriovoracaceae bacterium]
MSSERFLNSIYLLSRNPLGKQIFRIIYYLAFSIAKYWLVKYTSAKHVYIKGSYATGEWEPIVSDLDFVLIYNSYPPKKDRETVEKLKSFIPLIKDVDIYTKAQLKLQIKYGSFKNSDFDSWRPLNVRWNTSAKRLSYPKKNILDRIDDIYFYVEWFFQNIDDSGKINSYRLACLRRNLERVAGLVEKLNPKLVSKTYLLNHPLSNVKNAQQAFNWLNHVLEQLDLDLILFSVGKATHLSEILEVQQRDYYKQNFKVITSADEMKLEKNKITLSLSAFKLFYSTGCIDSYVLYTNFTKTNDEFFNCLMVVRYYLKLEQGRTNHVHKNTNDFELNERRREALSKLVNIRTFNLQENFIGKSVFVTASWGKEYLRRLGETHRQLHKLFGQDLSFLHVCLDGEDTFFESLESLSSVKIDEGEEYLGLWHKESLYNLAKRFLVGAEEIVFSDIDVIINDDSWWTDLKLKLETTEAVQPFSVFEDQETGKKVSSSVAALEKGEETFYAPGLIWAFNKDGFRKFGLFFDLFQDGSNDGVIFKQITKANIGVVENMTWTSREIANAMPRTDITYGYIDHTLSHISHPSPKQYDNMIEFFNIMLPEMRTHVERDHLGLWRWKKIDDGFKELFQQFMKDRGFASEEFKKLFVQRRDMLLKFKVDESTLYLNEQKNVKIYSPPEELSFFLGSEFE